MPSQYNHQGFETFNYQNPKIQKMVIVVLSNLQKECFFFTFDICIDELEFYKLFDNSKYAQF
jgi:hypothetical protein